MKIAGVKDGFSAEFRVNFEADKPAPQYPEAKASGFTKIFRGYGRGESVVVEQNFELEELEALVSAAQDAGITKLKIALKGNLERAKEYLGDKKGE